MRRKTHKSLLGRHLSQEKVYEVPDKILHCSALYGIIVLTKTNDHLPRRREPCSIPCELSCVQAKLNYWNILNFNQDVNQNNRVTGNQ